MDHFVRAHALSMSKDAIDSLVIGILQKFSNIAEPRSSVEVGAYETDPFNPSICTLSTSGVATGVQRDQGVKVTFDSI